MENSQSGNRLGARGYEDGNGSKRVSQSAGERGPWNRAEQNSWARDLPPESSGRARPATPSGHVASLTRADFVPPRPEEYYLYDIVDYIYRVMMREFKHYAMPRQVYKWVPHSPTAISHHLLCFASGFIHRAFVPSFFFLVWLLGAWRSQSLTHGWLETCFSGCVQLGQSSIRHSTLTFTSVVDSISTNRENRSAFRKHTARSRKSVVCRSTADSIPKTCWNMQGRTKSGWDFNWF